MVDARCSKGVFVFNFVESLDKVGSQRQNFGVSVTEVFDIGVIFGLSFCNIVGLSDQVICKRSKVLDKEKTCMKARRNLDSVCRKRQKMLETFLIKNLHFCGRFGESIHKLQRRSR